MSFRGNINIPITADLQPLDGQLRAGVGKLDAFGKSTERVGKRVDTLSASAKRGADNYGVLGGSIQRTTGHLGQYSDGLRGANRVGADAATTHGKMKESLAGWAAKIVSVTAVVGLAREALQGYTEDLKLAETAIKNTSIGRRDVATITFTPEEQKAFQKKANEISMDRRFGGMGRAEALQLVFQANSSSIGENVEDVAEAATLFGSETASTIAGKVPNLFKDKLSVRQALSMSLLGASQADISGSQFGKALPMAAESSLDAGTSPAELIAALSATTTQFTTASTAAERLRALQVAISKVPELAGGGLVGGIEGLKAMPQEDRDKALSDQGAKAAFNSLLLREQIFRERKQAAEEDQLITARSGGRAGRLAIGLGVRRSDVKFAAETMQNIAVNEQEIKDEDKAAVEMIRQSARQRRRTASGPATRGLFDVLDSIGIPGTQVDMLSLAEAGGRAALGGPLKFEGANAANEMAQVAREQLAEAKKMNETLREVATSEPAVIDSLP